MGDKTAAARIGMALEDYVARRAAGERWCFRCRRWLPDPSFRRDVTRPSGRAAICAPCHNQMGRDRYARQKGRRANG